MILKNQKLQFWLVLVILFCAFWIYGNTNLDPDFGWHLKMGELISQSGIPKTDPFSYTMASFPFVDHEWLTNIILSKLYPIIGLPGLSAIFSLLVIATLLILFPKKLKEWNSASFFLAAGVFISFAGVRTQIITWFFLSLLLRIITDEILWGKYQWVLPFIFLFWANMHAGFAAGIIVLMVANGVKSIVILSKMKGPHWAPKFYTVFKLTKNNWLVFLASLAVTFINPYGWHLWGEVGMQISDSGLHSSIAEWIPAYYYLDLSFLILVAFTLSFIFYRFNHRNFQPPVQLFLFVGLFLTAISAIRHIPLWTIVSTPLLAVFFEDFFQGLKNDKYGKKIFKICYRGLIFIVIAAFLVGLVTGIYNGQKFSEGNYYPKQAIQYLKSQKINGQIFSSYDWGGYLIWKYPEKKVFVDGRMPSWRRDYAPADESQWAFQDYEHLVDSNEEISIQFNKFHISTVIWPVPPQADNKNLIYLIQNKYYQLSESLFPTKSPVSFRRKLEESGWKEIYHDKVSVIYQKG